MKTLNKMEDHVRGIFGRRYGHVPEPTSGELANETIELMVLSNTFLQYHERDEILRLAHLSVLNHDAEMGTAALRRWEEMTGEKYPDAEFFLKVEDDAYEVD